jgi:hypothetical protein
MPLRDHFRPPVWTHASWEGFQGMWPATIVMHLSQLLPSDFAAEPRVHLGSYFEIDVCAFERDSPDAISRASPTIPGRSATSTWVPPEPTLAVDAEFPDQYEYEVLVYDQSRGRVLVAAVEIVSPANKDRLENRRAFVAKCATLLQKGVCVSIVDLVTIRRFNLYSDLLDLMGQTDPTYGPTPPAIYAATCRGRKVDRRSRFETWSFPLQVGQPLPTLPIWLSEEQVVSLELEASYEETCRVLRIP